MAPGGPEASGPLGLLRWPLGALRLPGNLNLRRPGPKATHRVVVVVAVAVLIAVVPTAAIAAMVAS